MKSLIQRISKEVKEAEKKRQEQKRHWDFGKAEQKCGKKGTNKTNLSHVRHCSSQHFHFPSSHWIFKNIHFLC